MGGRKYRQPGSMNPTPWELYWNHRERNRTVGTCLRMTFYVDAKGKARSWRVAIPVPEMPPRGRERQV